VLKIRSIEKYDPKQRILDEIDVGVVPLTIKSEDFHVKLEVSLEDKIYLKTYYYHGHDDIQVDETPTKNIGIKSLNNILDFDLRTTTC
jgi:hypothetical protein